MAPVGKLLGAAQASGGPSQIIDLSSAIIADGSTDNATALLALRATIAGPGKPHYILHFPAGGDIRYSDNRWLFGVERFTIEGHGSIFRSIYEGGDWLKGRPFFGGDIWQTNTLTYGGTVEFPDNYLFDTVEAGSITVTTSTDADAGNFDAGDRLLLWGGEHVGHGFPPGVRYYEWHEVESADEETGIITLTSPIKYNYDAAWHDISGIVGDGSAGGVGKPRITKLNRADYVYPRYAAFNNLTFGDATGGYQGDVIYIAEELHLKNVKQETGWLWPSENKTVTYEDMTVKDIEHDKIVGRVYFKRVSINGRNSGGSGVEFISFDQDCQMAESSWVHSREVEIRNCTLRGNNLPDSGYATIQDHPGRNPVFNYVLEKNRFVSTAANTVDHIAMAPHESYTILAVSGNNIIIPFTSYSDATSAPVRAIEPGRTRIYKSDGSKAGVVTSITFDDAYNAGQGAWVITGTWNVAPVAAEVWKWSSVLNVQDLGGHLVLDGKRLYNENSLRFSGNRGLGRVKEMHLTQHSLWWGGPNAKEIPFCGTIIDIEGNIGKIYNGTDIAAKFSIQTTADAEIFTLNLLQTGRRMMNEFESFGAKSGDVLTNNSNVPLKHQSIKLVTYGSDGSIDDVTPETMPEMDIIVRWREF